ncbi:MAG: beta-ketoacyl-ACP synthase 3 [Thermoguttaceae bacterium]
MATPTGATPFRMPLCLPAQAASETEATIIEWRVGEGDRFRKGTVLAQVDSAKSVFDFEAPCDGLVIRLLHVEGETVPLAEPVLEIETTDRAMREWIPPVGAWEEAGLRAEPISPPAAAQALPGGVVLRGIGAYLPPRVVTNAELVRGFSDITDQYVFDVTGIRQRHWAADGERPSAMAFQASLEAIRSSGLATKDIDAVIVATTTPDVAIPATASILQDQLNLPTVPAFDLNAACSGWLYGVAMARGMILSGLARNVLTVGVDLQSRLLDPADRNSYFLFGDGAGAAIVSAGAEGHRICQTILGADSRGGHMARRDTPGYLVANGHGDPWIRIDGHALFRSATEGFSTIIRQAMVRSGWSAGDTRWVIPHQANGRIIKAAAKRSGIDFERFYINVGNVGNTSAASIPIALAEVEKSLCPGDKLILCSVGAGITTAAVSIEW